VDQAGNVIVLSVAGSAKGKVYFWDHELEAPEGELQSSENVHPVADSFQSFLDGLQPLSDASVEGATE
jgi:hypothetical protein